MYTINTTHIYIYKIFASDITFPTCVFPGPTLWAPCSSRLLPGDAHSVGPVVGWRLGDGSLRFDGMDDWLGELYEGHKPRAIPGWGAAEHRGGKMESKVKYIDVPWFLVERSLTIGFLLNIVFHF